MSSSRRCARRASNSRRASTRARCLREAAITETDGQESHFRASYLRYALILLALGNLLNYLDRNIIFALFEPIKLDLGASDAQLGWLGAAYAIVFSLGALFSGVLSDLFSRRAVLAGGVDTGFVTRLLERSHSSETSSHG